MFRGVVENIAQPAVINVLVTHERISEDIVHDMAKAIAENLDTLPQMNPLFKGLKDLFEPLRRRAPLRSSSAVCRCIRARFGRIGKPDG